MLERLGPLDPNTTYVAMFQTNSPVSLDVQRSEPKLNGYMGLGPFLLSLGDMMCLIPGCNVRLVIQKHSKFHVLLERVSCGDSWMANCSISIPQYAKGLCR
jgi:hypothetical protein